MAADYALPSTSPDNPERALVLAYARPGDRPGMAAMLALDDTLAAVLRGVGEPMLAQMRLTWWHDAIGALDGTPPPAQPLLQALADHVVARGIGGADVARVIEGWEALLDAAAPGDDWMHAHARGRGEVLFETIARALGTTGSDAVRAAGRGWALADLARHLGDPGEAARAAALGWRALDDAFAAPWPPAARPIGALALLARLDLRVALDAPVPHGAPHRVARLLWHRLSGR